MASYRIQIQKAIVARIGVLPEFKTVEMLDTRPPEKGGNSYHKTKLPKCIVEFIDDRPDNEGPHSGIVEKTVNLELGLFAIRDEDTPLTDDEIVDELATSIERILNTNDEWGLPEAVHLTLWDGVIAQDTDQDHLMAWTMRLRVRYQHDENDPEAPGAE